MLIDRTYFVGDIDIPNCTVDGPVAETLDWFIEKYETEFLKKALGYTMYKAFQAGLLVDPVADKWTQLLEGVEYTNLSSKLAYWDGLVSLPLSVINAVNNANTTIIIVGRGNLYDPDDGATTTIIPAALVGHDFTFTQRLIGELRPDEYSVAGNVLTLTDSTFSLDDTYFFKSTSLTLSQSAGLNKKSPIANYIYYWFMRDNISQTASMGEVKSTTENAVMASPEYKMQRAWNDMSYTLRSMREYLRANVETYDYKYYTSELFNNINVFNL